MEIRAIARGIKSPRLADIAIAHIYASAEPPGPEQVNVVEFLRQRLIAAAGIDRSIDEWTNELNTIIRVGTIPPDMRRITDEEKRGTIAVLTMLAPFVRNKSLGIAADLVTKIREKISDEHPEIGECALIGGLLVDMSRQAESKGLLELAADVLERATDIFPAATENGLFIQIEAIDTRAKHLASRHLGELKTLETFDEVAALVRERTQGPGGSIERTD